jgi:hypothetical protein
MVVIADLAVGYFAVGLYRSRTPEEGRKAMRRLYITMTLFTVALIVSRFLA